MNSIVAYRNPMEQWLWESGVAWFGIGLIGLIVALPIILLLAINVTGWVTKRFRR